ncbi:hypothetical protein V8C44DRAFT_339182 [Trichoderma aethiopicum]
MLSLSSIVTWLWSISIRKFTLSASCRVCPESPGPQQFTRTASFRSDGVQAGLIGTLLENHACKSRIHFTARTFFMACKIVPFIRF